MKVLRIVANVATTDHAEASAFYQDILGLDLLMDLGWIQTFGSDQSASVQISVASEGGSGTDVPDLSIEVDDLDAVLEALSTNAIEPVYGPVLEPWGVRRIYVRDPMGKLLNILQHQ